jgi:hypothetical protein
MLSPVQTSIGTVFENGLYAVVHWVIESIDGEVSVPIYGQESKYDNYMIDGNCSLVKWSCKQNKAVSDPIMKRKTITELHRLSADLLAPTIGIIRVSQIVRPCIAIADNSPLAFPHEYHFIETKKHWPNLWMEKTRDNDFLLDIKEQVSNSQQRAEKRGRYLVEIETADLTTSTAKSTTKKRKKKKIGVID